MARLPNFLQVAWRYTEPYVPDLFTKRRFNFITIHYLYIGGMSILGSILMFSMGGLSYVDALFFASGSSTQSGLNTVDLNLLRTGQQFICYLFALLCNPIIIHGSVVFVRLHMFEKRFKNIVKEARDLRRSKSRARLVSRGRDDPEMGREEKGVRGRPIVVMRNGTLHQTIPDEKNTRPDIVVAPKESPSESDDSTIQAETPERPFVIGSEDDPGVMRSPKKRNTDENIAWLENQRSPKDKTALRIPGPREFEQGKRPEHMDVDESMNRKISSRLDVPPAFSTVHYNGTPVTAHQITFNEPNISRSRNENAITFEKDAGRPSRSLSRTRSRQGTRLANLIRANSNFLRTVEDEPEAPYLSWVPTVVRNSTFVDLSEEQREELGGIEYRALKTLAIILSVYFFAFHILGVICLVPWIMKSGQYGPVVTDIGQGRPWWGIFTAASAFNDLGFTLTPDSMISFSQAEFPLLLMTFLILIGNTGFPCMLRFVIWLMAKFTPRGTGLWEELRFLLDHPRRCFTLLFPSSATWWLFAILIFLNAADIFFFIVLDLGKPEVSAISGGYRFLDALFQAASTRTAGFAVVNLADLHPATQVTYMIMMYISVLPIAISMRRTNVYEEKSLGIYSEINTDADNGKTGEPSYVGAHLRRQLSFDLWYVFLGLFLIAIIEGKRIENTQEDAFNLFSCLFEIISAYGTVGLSLGYPGVNTSLSGVFKTTSKLVIIAMQIRGRHRGLPYELDRAVLLPSESLQKKEAVEARKMAFRRRNSLAALSQLDLEQIRSHQTNPLHQTATNTTQNQNQNQNFTTPQPTTAYTSATNFLPLTPISHAPHTPAPTTATADMARIPTMTYDEAHRHEHLPTVPEDVTPPQTVSRADMEALAAAVHGSGPASPEIRHEEEGQGGIGIGRVWGRLTGKAGRNGTENGTESGEGEGKKDS